jgi:glycosyltransferase involved in cell wall biosynthesis
MKNHKQTVGENKNDQCDIFCLDDAYSTTRRITTCPPDPDNKPDDAFETVLFLPEGTERNGEGGLRTKGYFKKSQVDRPLVSIITVVFNGDNFLEETIQSVFRQSYDNVEYIVIDGGSTDKTLEVIKKYEGQIDYWVSEKDDGIYHAINKGITLCTGDIIGCVNADDYIFKDTISKLAHIFTHNKISYLYGSIDLLSKNGNVFAKAFPLEKDSIEKQKFQGIPFPHPTLYIHKEWFKIHGCYSLKYKLSSDYDLMLRLIVSKAPSFCIQDSFGGFRLGGLSGGIKSFIENNVIVRNHGLSTFQAHYYLAKSLLKILLVTLLPPKLFAYLKKFQKKSRIIYYGK